MERKQRNPSYTEDTDEILPSNIKCNYRNEFQQNILNYKTVFFFTKKADRPRKRVDSYKTVNHQYLKAAINSPDVMRRTVITPNKR